jgi:peptidoglycan hydrolase-like protein with peptidoglycan-binding domain
MISRHRIAVLAGALTLGGVMAVASASSASAATYTCNYRFSGDNLYAGYYSGTTVQPSSSGVSSAGIEAQCLLKYRQGFNPGSIDGVFGSNSQSAARAFQAKINYNYSNVHLVVDGKVGPSTWPYLRNQSYSTGG